MPTEIICKSPPQVPAGPVDRRPRPEPQQAQPHIQRHPLVRPQQRGLAPAGRTIIARQRKDYS